MAVLIAVTLVPVTADTCKSAAGPFTSQAVAPPECLSPVGICTTGTLQGPHPETYSFVMDTLVPSPDGVPGKYVYTGHSVITRTHGGATLYGEDSGVIFLGSNVGPFVTTVNIVDGTKQFSNASGQYVATGELDFITGAATGTFTSTVCK